MAIGRYRDVPAEMDDLECRVAAAQYPEGGLVVGMGLGIVLGMALSPVAVAVGPIVGALALVVGNAVSVPIYVLSGPLAGAEGLIGIASRRVTPRRRSGR